MLNRAVKTATLLVASLLLTGCGWPAANGTTASSSGSKREPAARPTDATPGNATGYPVVSATVQQPAATSDVATSESDPGGDQAVPVRIDAQGRKWLGKVPYDVFFDDPVAVASQGSSHSPAVNLAPQSSTGKSGEGTASRSVAPIGADSSNSQEPAEKSVPGSKGEALVAKSVAPASAAADDWKSLLDIEVVDAEVKRIRNALTADVQSVAKYNGNFQDIRVLGATLAAMAEIAAEHPSATSWKASAPIVRELGLKIHNAATAQGGKEYQATKGCYEQLVDVLDGNAPADLPPAPPRRQFAEVADRRALMKRMDRAFAAVKKPQGRRAATKDSAPPLHEATVLAALARVITVGGYDSGSDVPYKENAIGLQQAGTALVAALKSEDKTASADAISRIQKRCDACHADFRFE